MGEGKCQPQYFLHTMEWWEIERYIAGIRRAERPGWEQTRLAGLWQISSMGGKVKLHDLMKFSWDDQESEMELPSDEEIEQMQREMREYNEQHAKKDTHD